MPPRILFPVESLGLPRLSQGEDESYCNAFP